MTVNQFLEIWNPAADYIDAGALKKRFKALRGLSNVRPTLSEADLVELADNVLETNREQYESLAVLNPYKTYAETYNDHKHNQAGGTDTHTETDTRRQQETDTASGTDTGTETDTRKQQQTNKPGVTTTTDQTYGRADTRTGSQKEDETELAYNSTSAQPTRSNNTTFNSVKDQASGKDTQVVKQEGQDVATSEILSGDLKNEMQYGRVDTKVSEVLSGNLENTTDYGRTDETNGDGTRSGYVLKDIVELMPDWRNIYDRIVQDVFSVIGSLVATRKIDHRLDW